MEMNTDILNFIAVMFGVAVLLIGAALLVYTRKTRRRRELTDPHHDHLYHYTKPRITDVPVDYYEHRHHHRHHKKEA